MGRLDALCREIRDTHHAFLREHLPRIAVSIVRDSARGSAAGRLLLGILADRFRTFEEEIVAHILKEERVLFPAIDAAERALENPRGPDAGILCEVLPSVRHLMFEHESGERALRDIEAAAAEIRRAGVTVSGELLSGVAALAADLREHIRKKEEELFPAVAAAEEAFHKQPTHEDGKEEAG